MNDDLREELPADITYTLETATTPDPLLPLLQHESPTVVQETVMKLLSLDWEPESTYEKVTVAVLSDTEQPSLDSQAIPVLIDYLDHPDDAVIERVLTHLEALQAVDAVGDIVEFIYAEDVPLALRGIEVLGNIAEMDDLPTLKDFQRDCDKRVRQAANDAEKRLRQRVINDKENGFDNIQEMLKGNKKARRMAEQMLHNTLQKADERRLADAMRYPGTIRQTAMHLMIQKQPDRKADMLWEWLKQDDSSIRHDALITLRGTKMPQRRAMILHMLDDPVTGNQNLAIDLTGMLRQDDTLREALLRLLADKTLASSTVKLVLNKLGLMRRKDLFDHIVPFLTHSNSRVRLETVRALGRCGHPESIPAMARILEDGSGSRKMIEYMAIALGDLNTPEAIPLLMQILEMRQPAAAFPAILALVQLDHTPAIPLLKDMLTIRHDHLRRYICWALVELGDTSSADLIKPLMDRRLTRPYAALALGYMGYRVDPSDIKPVLSARDKKVRNAARRVITQLEKQPDESLKPL